MSGWGKADELENFWKNSPSGTVLGICFYLMGKTQSYFTFSFL